MNCSYGDTSPIFRATTHYIFLMGYSSLFIFHIKQCQKGVKCNATNEFKHNNGNFKGAMVYTGNDDGFFFFFLDKKILIYRGE